MTLKFERFLQRFNNRLTNKESPSIKREDLQSYLQQHATLVPLGRARNWSVNLIEPGRVYLHWFKDNEIWDDETVRIQVALRNPAFGMQNIPRATAHHLTYLESSLAPYPWTRATFSKPDEWPSSMSLNYRNGEKRYWNGWQSPELEVWEFPLWALGLNTLSLNYPEGDLL
jgi:hypothetical protein